MTTLAYTIPTPGVDLNSIADPELTTALATIRTWANGGIDSSNIALGSGYVRWALRTASANVTAAAGDWILATSGSFTVTLPPAASNMNGVVAITNGNVGVVTVSSGAAIGFVGNPGTATSFLLGTPNSSAVLQSDGSLWRMIAGQQDTGWVTLGLTANLGTGTGPGGYNVAAARLRGDKGELCGIIQNLTGGTITVPTTITTLPAAMRPAATIPVAFGMNAQNAVQTAQIINTTGVIQTTGSGSWNNTVMLDLDGVNFRVI